MPVKNVWIEDGCTSCGLCEEICPEVFVMVAESTVKHDVDFSRHEGCIKEAAENCPVEVIKYE